MKSVHLFLLSFILAAGLGATFSGCVADGGGVAVGVYPDPWYGGPWAYGHPWHGGGWVHPYRR